MNKEYWRQHFDVTAASAQTTSGRSLFISKSNARVLHKTVRKLIGTGVVNKLVLDAGCGDGTVSAPLVKNNTVIGLDFSVPMLSHAGDKGILPFCCDMEYIGLRPVSVDFVISIEAVTLLERPYDAVSALCGLLKLGGRILISVLNDTSVIRKLVSGHYRRQGWILPNPLNILRMCSILEKADCRVTQKMGIVMFPFCSFAVELDGAKKAFLPFVNNLILIAEKD